MISPGAPRRFQLPGLRLGCTSFLLPEAYVPAMRHAAACCEDVCLLLMESDARGEPLISDEELAEIGRIADGEGTSLCVHLPGGRLDRPDDMFQTRARRAMERTLFLRPHTFILHMEAPSLAGTGRGPNDKILARGNALLTELVALLPSPDMLALENLEGYAAEMLEGWMLHPVSRCVDIGHIWKDGADSSRTAALLDAWLPRARICHLHGVENGHAHRGLTHTPSSLLETALNSLLAHHFHGVVTLEIFSPEVFTASVARLREIMENLDKKTPRRSAALRLRDAPTRFP